MSSIDENKKLLFLPRYTYAEATRISLIKSDQTAKKWLEGYTYVSDGKKRQSGPVTPIPRKNRDNSIVKVSFLDLVEIALIHQLRQRHISLQLIKQAVAYCQEEFGVERPLVTYEFKVGGKEIFIKIQNQLLEVGRKAGQHAIEDALDPFLHQLDHNEAHRLVTSWWPLGKKVPVFINPEYGFGRPVIKGTGVRTEIIAEQFRVGSSLDDIAYDFDLTRHQVESALRFELQQTA